MKQRKKLEAQIVMGGIRGQYLISQALCIAVRAMRKRPKHLQEPSNIADMELLITQLFPIYREIEKVKEVKKHEDKND
jgi:hypothetical protein